LIRHLGGLREGSWPPDASSYIDAHIGKRSVSSKAPYITAVEYAAEIEVRLEKCGIDGLILLAMECWDMSEEVMSKYFKAPVWSIGKRYKRALRYVASGPARRWMNTRKREAVSYQEYGK